MLIFNCLRIFCARIVDVTLGTLRTVLFVRGKSLPSFVIAFFEVLIWFYTTRIVLKTEESTFLIAIFYALGYATGTYIGSKISKKIKSVVGVQVVVKKNKNNLINKLRSINYGISVIPMKDKNDLLLIEINNNKLNELMDIIKEYDEDAFVTVYDTKYVNNGLIK